MNRKKLPKVIVPTPGDAPVTPAGEVSTRYEAPASSEIHPPVRPPEDDAPRPGAFSATVVDLRPTPRSRNDVARRARALRIVNRHACYSAVGGVVPLPFATFASVTAVIVRMVKVLADHYRVPFERDRARTIVIGLAAGVMPSGAAAVASSSLFYVVPGSALIGLVVSSASAAACTRSIGRIFIEHFENGATLNDLAENMHSKVA
jgi:uncharacterized protein (DUF697 family)